MNDRLRKMVELSQQIKVNDFFQYKNLEAKVLAFSDEHVFAVVPEVIITPEEFEGAVGHKLVRDQNVERLRKENHQLNNEIERLLLDPEYYKYRAHQRDRERRYRERELYRMDRSYDEFMLRAKNTGFYGGADFGEGPSPPPKPIWIDPLWKEEPGAGQKKSKKK